jgi:hypothetical protein
VTRAVVAIDAGVAVERTHARDLAVGLIRPGEDRGAVDRIDEARRAVEPVERRAVRAGRIAPRRARERVAVRRVRRRSRVGVVDRERPVESVVGGRDRARGIGRGEPVATNLWAARHDLQRIGIHRKCAVSGRLIDDRGRRRGGDNNTHVVVLDGLRKPGFAIVTEQVDRSGARSG